MPPTLELSQDEKYGLEPANAPAPKTDDEYGLEPAKPAAAKPVPVRKPGEAKQLTQEEVNAFQPPTKFEQAHPQPTPMPTYVPGMGIVDAAQVGHAAKEFGSDILGMGKSMAEQFPGMGAIGHVASGEFGEAAKDVLPGARLIEGGIEHLKGVQESDAQRKEAGRSLPYRALAGGAQATGVVDPTSMEAAAERGDTSGVLAHAGAQAAPILAAEAIRSPAGRAATSAIKDVAARAGEKVAQMRQPGRIATFDEVLRELAGKTPADLDFTKTLDKVRPDIAKIARESGFEQQGNARVGEFEQMLGNRERQIWSQEHVPQIQAQGHVVFDPEVPAQRATASLSKQMRADNPAAARAVDRWIASTLNPDVIGTVEGADKLMRSLNAANPDVPEPFKNLMRIAKNAAGDAIREQLEAKLQDAGEEGVSNPHGRWGGLREIRTAIQGRLNNAANQPLSSWDTLRNAGRTGAHGSWMGAGAGGLVGAVFGEPALGAEIGGGIGATVGGVGSVAHDILSEPGGRIARAMRGLGKTDLQPNEVQPGTPRLPWQAGPDTSGPTRGGIGPYSIWNPPQPPPTGAGGAETVLAPDEGRIGATGREGTRFAPKGLLPAPPPESPVGVLPTLGGPVTSPMWGRPVVQPKPGFELPNQELTGPWGGGAAPETPPQTVAPMKPPVTPEPTAKTLAIPKETPKAAEIKALEKPVERRSPESEGKPPQGTIERRSIKDVQGPSMMRKAVMDDIQRQIDDPKTPDEERKVLQARLDDMKAHPFERAEGEMDINRIKAFNKPTLTREEAEAKTESRKAARKARFEKPVEK